MAIDWNKMRSSVDSFLSEERTITIGNPLFLGASLSINFTPKELIKALRELGRISPESITNITDLLDNSDEIKNKSGKNTWKLKDTVRLNLLKEISESNIDIHDLLPKFPGTMEQEMFNHYVLGTAPEVDDQTYHQAMGSLKAYEWLRALKIDVPPKETLQFRKEYLELTLAFERLTQNFQGRVNELQELNDYVGWVDTSLSARIKNTVSGEKNEPLLIHGIGGIGKTTLVAKFVLTNIRNKNSDRNLPYVYIDFDKEGVVAQEPLSLFAEALRQLILQFPGWSKDLNKIRKDVQSRLQGLIQQKDSKVSFERKSSDRDRSLVLHRFQSVWERISKKEPLTILLVLDSFEEVQNKQSQSDIQFMMSFIRRWNEIIGSLKTVLVGRSGIPEIKTQLLPIANFDNKAAAGYLVSRGIKEPSLSKKIIELVDGNPLSLSLAAAIVLKNNNNEQVTGLENIKKYSYWLFKVKQEEIQEQLFKRNLEHIHDPLVRKMAMPGLIVRYIDEAVIEHVLNVPCDLNNPNPKERRRMMDLIRKETFLIVEGQDGRIRFRPELRRNLLPMIHSVEEYRGAAIKVHRAAIDYYDKSDDIESQAEALYHRLMLGEKREKLDAIYRSEMRNFLQHSESEMPSSSRVFLADKFGITLPEEVYKEVETNQRINKVKYELERALMNGENESLQYVIDYSNRLIEDDHDHARLYFYQALVHIRLGQFPEARKIIEELLQRTGQELNFDLSVQLELCLSEIAEIKEEYLQAFKYAEQALNASVAKESLFNLVQSLTYYQRLSARLNKKDLNIDEHWAKALNLLEADERINDFQLRSLSFLAGKDSSYYAPKECLQELSRFQFPSGKDALNPISELKALIRSKVKSNLTLDFVASKLNTPGLEQILFRGSVLYENHYFILYCERNGLTEKLKAQLESMESS